MASIGSGNQCLDLSLPSLPTLPSILLPAPAISIPPLGIGANLGANFCCKIDITIMSPELDVAVQLINVTMAEAMLAAGAIISIPIEILDTAIVVIDGVLSLFSFSVACPTMNVSVSV